MNLRTVIGCTIAWSALACSSPETSPTGTSSSGATSASSTGTGDMGPPTISFLDLADTAPAPTTTVLWTDPIDIRLDHLPSNADVTIEARYVGWGATATFTSDAMGAIDLSTAEPTSGSYTGVDREGIVWSMTPSQSASDQGADPYALRVTATIDGAQVATATLTRLAKSTDVQCMKVTDNGLVGFYCSKTGAPPAGAIVVFGGSEGGLGTGQELAEYYASLGYPSLGLAYFGAPGVPAQLSEVPLEYFEKAFTWLSARSEVTPGKLAVIGGSRGGELALLLGATFPNVTAVVAMLPSGVLWGAPNATGTSEVASFTYQGQPLAWVPYIYSAEKKVTEPDGVVAYADRTLFEQSIAMATPTELAQGTTKVESTHGPILMLAAADDQIWPSCDLAQISMDRLMAAGHVQAHGDSLVCYPDAGHNITPFSLNVPTTTSMHSSAKVSGEYLALGGKPDGIAHGARDADDKTRAFLAQALR